jgi:hypothetical protein
VLLLSPVLASSPVLHQQEHSVSSHNERKLIVNEVLFFVQNKLESTSMETIIQLCSGFYSVDDVINNKSVLFDAVHPRKDLLKEEEMIK